MPPKEGSDYKMSLHHYPKIVTNGLVLCLDAANPSSYPGTGNTWYDLSNNGNNFTLSNSVYDNQNRGSLSMGSNIRIYKSGTVLNKDNNLTIIVVFSGSCSYLEGHSIGCTLNYLSANNTSASLDQYGPAGTGSRANLSYSSNSGIKIIAHTLTSDRTATWFYNGSFYSGGTGETYADFCGPLEETIIGNRTVSTNTNHSPVSGRISIIQIYNRALLSSEIQQNYNAIKGRYSL
jgi:hypothetical protein